MRKQKMNFTSIFRNFDKNSDGQVTKEEMRHGIREAIHLELSDEEATVLPVKILQSTFLD